MRKNKKKKTKTLGAHGGGLNVREELIARPKEYWQLIEKYNIEFPPNCSVETLANLIAQENKSVNQNEFIMNLLSSNDALNSLLAANMMINLDFNNEKEEQTF